MTWLVVSTALAGILIPALIAGSLAPAYTRDKHYTDTEWR